MQTEAPSNKDSVQILGKRNNYSSYSIGLISANLQDIAKRPKRKHHLVLLRMTHGHLLFRTECKSLPKDMCCGNKASRKAKQIS